MGRGRDSSLEAFGECVDRVHLGHRLTGGERLGHGVRQLALDADQADVSVAEACGQPSEEAPAPYREHNRGQSGKRVEQLEGDRAAVACRDEGIVVGRDEEAHVLISAGKRLGLVVARLLGDAHLGAQPRDPQPLDVGRPRRDVHPRRDPHRLRRVREAEPMIASARRHHARRALLRVQGSELRQRPAHLEGPGLLLVLELEPHAADGLERRSIRRRQRHQRRPQRVLVRDLPRELQMLGLDSPLRFFTHLSILPVRVCSTNTESNFTQRTRRTQRLTSNFSALPAFSA